MPKTERTFYLVTDYGGEYEDAWECPYMAFDNEQDANECAEKRKKRNQYESLENTKYLWDGYVSSVVNAIPVLIDEPTCENVYDETAYGPCDNGFKCSVCGEMVQDYECYRVLATWNYCPGCGRKVVKGGH